MDALIEKKNEFTSHLLELITESIVTYFIEIYNNLITTDKNTLSSFQNILMKMPDWSNHQVENVYEYFMNKIKCNYINDLIKETIIVYVKIQALSNNITNEIRLKRVYPESFFHRVILLAAKQFLKQPYLFYHNIKSVEKQYNLNQIEEIIKKSIINGVRSFIPMDQIINVVRTNNPEESEEDSQEDSQEDSEEESEESEESEEESEEDSEEESDEEADEESDKELILPVTVKATKPIPIPEPVLLSINEKSPLEETVQAVREEAVREEAVREEAVREEAVREEAVREEAAKEEAVREEAVREEAVREEAAREEAAREEAAREEAVREEAVREEAVKEEAVREEREEAAKEEAVEEVKAQVLLEEEQETVSIRPELVPDEYISVNSPVEKLNTNGNVKSILIRNPSQINVIQKTKKIPQLKYAEDAFF